MPAKVPLGSMSLNRLVFAQLPKTSVTFRAARLQSRAGEQSYGIISRKLPSQNEASGNKNTSRAL